uniref:Uncharacterized protein n=1 Tax=Caenorhabditis japonica TaxID=281687 RepID=A0A8R1EMA2_CAEJA
MLSSSTISLRPLHVPYSGVFSALSKFCVLRIFSAPSTSRTHSDSHFLYPLLLLYALSYLGFLCTLSVLRALSLSSLCAPFFLAL